MFINVLIIHWAGSNGQFNHRNIIESPVVQHGVPNAPSRLTWHAGRPSRLMWHARWPLRLMLHLEGSRPNVGVCGLPQCWHVSQDNPITTLHRYSTNRNYPRHTKRKPTR